MSEQERRVILEAIKLFREYEAHHSNQVMLCEVVGDLEGAQARRVKAKRNSEMSNKLEALL